MSRLACVGERTCCRIPIGSRSHVTALHIATVLLTYMRPTQRYGNPYQTSTPAAARFTRVNFSTAALPVKAPLYITHALFLRWEKLKLHTTTCLPQESFTVLLEGKKKKKDTVVRWTQTQARWIIGSCFAVLHQRGALPVQTAKHRWEPGLVSGLFPAGVEAPALARQ